MHQVDVNWRPPLSATSWTPPPRLPLPLHSPSFLRTNATFLPSVICSADSPSGPWRTPPCNLSTPGGGLFTQRWLGAPCTALVTSPPSYAPLFLFSPSFLFSTLILSWPLSLSLPLCPPPPLWFVHTHSPPLRGPLKHPQRDGGRRCSAEAQAAGM